MIPINLFNFCSPDKGRASINTPFSRDGYTWATDGCLLLRVSHNENYPEKDNAPNAKAVFDEIFVSDKMRDIKNIDKLPKPEKIECTECGGSGTDHACPDCTHECEWCNGIGTTEEKVSCSIDGKTFNMKYVKKLSQLPNIKIQTGKDNRGWLTLSFAFDGGEGVMMGMSSRYDKHEDVEL